jgi:hypothetical protein
MNLQDSVNYRNLSSFYPENNNFSHSYGIFNSVCQKEKISSMKRRLHAATGTERTEHHQIKLTFEIRHSIE